MTTKPTWPENRQPTPEEWSNWFVMLPNGEKLEVAEAVLDCGNKANRCFMEDHEGLRWEGHHLRELILLGKWLLAEREWEYVRRLEMLQVANKSMFGQDDETT